jgi:hypothetical protein
MVVDGGVDGGAHVSGGVLFRAEERAAGAYRKFDGAPVVLFDTEGDHRLGAGLEVPSSFPTFFSA